MKRLMPLVILLGLTGYAGAGVIVIDDALDSFAGVGDFSMITGFDSASSPGQVVEVLGGPGAGTAEFAAGRTTAMGSLWDALDAGGVASATTIGFGLGINQTGAVGTNWIDVFAMSFTFELPDSSLVTFDLGGEQLQVFNYNQGQSTAEAIFFIDLGFDFMTTYSSLSTEDFFVTGTLGNDDDGFEILFLGSAFSSVPPDPCDTNPPGQGGCPPLPTPEPGVLLLIGAGLLGLVSGRRRISR